MTRKEWIQSKSKRARNRHRSNNRDANRIKKIRMSYSRIGGAEEALAGRAGFGMPTFDHPVGGTCVAVGHPEVGTGKEWGVGRGSLLCQRPRLCCRVLRQASRMCAVAGYFFRCCITRWSLRALFDGGSLLLR